jgi:hypothetical protein
METQKITIDHTNAAPNMVIVVREGLAVAEKQTCFVELEGNITAPGDYVAHRTKFDQILQDKAVVIINLTEGGIKYISDPKVDPRDRVTVLGTLKKDVTIGRLRLNQKMDAKELSNVLRLNRALFCNKMDAQQIVEQLMGFKGTIMTQLESANDLKGSKRDLFETKLTHTVQLQFMAEMPVYRDETKCQFLVEICCDVVNGAPLFWLESPQYEELMDTMRELILNREAARFEGLTIINQ